MSVYFITAPELGLVKIGYSNAPKRRLAILQTGSPVKLELAAVVPAGVKQEKQLHRRFRANKKQLEWFEICAEISAIIDAHLVAKPARKSVRINTNSVAASPHIKSLIRDIAIFCERFEMPDTRFGELALNDKPFLSQIRKGRRLWPETESKVRDFMASYAKDKAA